MIRLIFVAVLLAACTPAVPAGASPSAAPPTSVATVAPAPVAPATNPLATTVPITPAPPTVAPVTPRQPSLTATPVPAPTGCDPYYDSCEDRYTPRPRATGTHAAATATPEPAGDDLVVGTSEDGSYLVGPDGMALYTFANDPPGASTCNGECAQAWPPLAVGPDQEPVAGDGVDGTLGITTRNDGSTQVTYNDAPLYNYNGDTAVGHTNGQGIAGVWYLAEP